MDAQKRDQPPKLWKDKGFWKTFAVYALFVTMVWAAFVIGLLSMIKLQQPGH